MSRPGHNRAASLLPILTMTLVGHTAAAAPGSSARVVWQSREMHVPAQLLARRQGRLGVFVATDKTARFHVLPGAQEGRPAKATGLLPDSRIVVRGLGEL